MMIQKTKNINTCVISEMYQAELFEDTFKGVGSNPFIVYRWSKCAGEVYGRGPLQLALPAIKTANLVIELILKMHKWQFLVCIKLKMMVL